jgi:phage tail sheath gpL-like
MTITPGSLAAAVTAGARNVAFQPTARTLPRKIGIIATYDPLKTEITADEPILVLSAEDVGDKCGFGFMAHRLAVQAFRGSRGIETYIIPQAEAGGAVASTGNFDFAGSAGVKAGTVHLYIAGLAVPFTIVDGDSADDLATKAAAAIEAVKELPVNAAVDGVTTSQVNVTAKSKGPWGDDISITFNLGFGQELPSGVAVLVTDMSGGAGIPDISTALDGLGTGDNANEIFLTDVVHGYGQDTTTLDAILAYVGAGNEFAGLYDRTVARPFRALTGDAVADVAGLTALIALADARLTDRANGVIAVPGSQSHPSEIAAQAIGHMARVNNVRAAESYVDIVLEEIWPGAKDIRWTSDYENRDLAVKSGISPTFVQSGVVTMQNVVSFYRPESVPVESNGYRSMRNISILQNILTAIKVNFKAEKWQGISIVQDISQVGDPIQKQKARDIGSVIDDLVRLAQQFSDNAWVYTPDFTIERLKEQGAVTVRDGGTGFNNLVSVILSGEGGIIDTIVYFDTSIAILTA